MLAERPAPTQGKAGQGIMTTEKNRESYYKFNYEDDEVRPWMKEIE